MRAYTLTVLIAVFFLAGCSKGTPDAADKGTGSTGTSTPVVVRQKIDRLTPKSYFKVSITLFEEQKKWNKEFQTFMQKKRMNFYRSFGLSEKQYNDYSIKNQTSIQDYLKRNPQLNRQMSRFRSMYTQ